MLSIRPTFRLLSEATATLWHATTVNAAHAIAEADAFELTSAFQAELVRLGRLLRKHRRPLGS